MPVDRATCCAHERAQTTENAKGYVRTHVLRLGECSFLLVGPEIVEHMLRDPTAILCRSCQQDLCKIAQLFKFVESKQSSALSYHSIYRFHRTLPSLPFTQRARAYAVLLYARRYLHHTHLAHLSYVTIYNWSHVSGTTLL